MGSSSESPKDPPRRTLTPQQIAANQPAAPVKPPAAPVAKQPPATPSSVPPPQPVAPGVAAPPKPDAQKFSAWFSEYKNDIAWSSTLFLLGLYIITAFVPWQPEIWDSELDSSWVEALHWAFLHGMDFGHQVIFTYGPWGFFLQGFHPATFKYTILGPSLFAAGAFVAFWQLARHLTPVKWKQALWMFAIISLAGSELHRELRAMSIAWLMVFLHFYHNDRPITWWKVLMVVALALGSLGKFTIFIGVLPLLLLITADELWRKKVPWLFIIFLFSCLVFWKAAGQPFLSIFPFLRNSFEISANHAQATGESNATETRDICLFMSGAILVMALACWGHWRTLAAGARREFVFYFRGALVLVGLAFMLFLAFKSGFVRHDVHEISANDALLMLAILVTTLFWRALGKWAWKGPALAIIAWCAGLSWHSDFVYTKTGLPYSASQALIDFPSRTASAVGWLTGSYSLQQKYDGYMEQFRASRTLPQVKGTVDLYPYSQRVLLAYGLDYHPRPTLQSYVASYAARLAQLNAEFLRGPDAPQSILYESLPFDGHYPSLDDGPSWPELLTRYDLKDATTFSMLLERSAQPRQYSFTPLGQFQPAVGDWVPVPQSDEPIWVTINLSQTLKGKIYNTLYKPPIVMLYYKTTEGKRAGSRLLPDAASGGFLLSPLTMDNLAFAMLRSDKWREELHDLLISQIQVAIEPEAGGASCYQTNYTVAFSALHYPHMDVMSVPGLARQARFKKWIPQAHVGSGQPQVVLGDVLQNVLLAQPLTQLMLDVPPDAKEVHVGFGMLKASYQNDPKTDGVEFRVYGVQTFEQNRITGALLLSHELNPTLDPRDRGDQLAIIPLPQPPPPKILLETRAGAKGISPYAYWSDVDFQK